MFRRNTLQGLVFLLILSAAAGQGLLALVCALLLLTAGLAWLWDRWSLARVSYERELSHPRAFPGDEVELIVRVANRKPLPLAMLDVRDIIPAGLEITGYDIKLDREGRQMLHR